VFVLEGWIVYTYVVERTELEVASRLPVIKVYTELGTIDVERHLFLLGLVLVVAKEVFNVERIAKEYPSPTEVYTEFSP
jgi:hypothetical protein